MPPATQRGLFVVFEGLDRSGKSTQCTRLAESLQREGRKVKHMTFPNRTTPIGNMIDSYLKGNSTQEDHVIHLMFSANRWEAAAEIEADIANGIDVVADRYFYSGCVYSAAKCNPSLDLEWARAPEVGLPAPDIVYFLDLSPEEAKRRGGYGSERYEKQEMQETVRSLFLAMRETKDGDVFLVVDANTSPDSVAANIEIALGRIRAKDNNKALPLSHVRPRET